MKRYGLCKAIESLTNGCEIEYNLIDQTYRVVDKDLNVIGYITFDLFTKLLNTGTIHLQAQHHLVRFYA